MKKPTLAVLALISFLTVGCATEPARTPSIERPQLQVDPDVLYSMSVTELFQERVGQYGQDGLLQVQFAVNAHADADLAWRVTWFDSNGMEVKGVGESYRKAKVLAGQTRYFQATAPHARATTYQLHLREPK